MNTKLRYFRTNCISKVTEQAEKMLMVEFYYLTRILSLRLSAGKNYFMYYYS